MELLRVLVVGAVQGVTEFLPISSDGHLLLVRELVGWADQGLAFDAALHFGTFLAVLIAFRTTWQRLVRSVARGGSTEDRTLLGLLILATIPGALAGFFLEDLIGTRVRGMLATGLGFLATAVFLLIADRVRRVRTVEQPSAVGAFAVGVLQSLALLPGLSRSGATIAGGMFVGLSRERAVEFSFLLAAPIVGGAGVYGFLQVLGSSTVPLVHLLVGLLAAFTTGLWAIRFLLRYVRTHSFLPFVAYLVAVALLSFTLR